MTRLVLAVIGALLLMAGCSSGGAAVPQGGSGEPPLCTYTPTGAASRPVEAPSQTEVTTSGTATLTLRMSGGTVTITGDRAATPCTWNALESLAKQGYFDDTACHRLADAGLRMVQCGDPTGTGRGTPGYRYADEIAPGTSYPAGTVAMANAGSGTNGSQFFIVFGDSALPPNYTVFGTVDAASLKVVETMAAKGHDGSYDDGTGRPNDPFRIVTATAG
ncbi:MAG: peptidylprolyl isomerase [Micropruina sp.]|nr:peptidylprolyl isomerase [Micropruina sp.]